MNKILILKKFKSLLCHWFYCRAVGFVGSVVTIKTKNTQALIACVSFAFEKNSVKGLSMTSLILIKA